MYLDPGLGSMIIQIAIAAVATAGAAFVFMRNRIFSWLGIKSKKHLPQQEESVTSEIPE